MHNAQLTNYYVLSNPPNNQYNIDRTNQNTYTVTDTNQNTYVPLFVTDQQLQNNYLNIHPNTFSQPGIQYDDQPPQYNQTIITNMAEEQRENLIEPIEPNEPNVKRHPYETPFIVLGLLILLILGIGCYLLFKKYL